MDFKSINSLSDTQIDAQYNDLIQNNNNFIATDYGCNCCRNGYCVDIGYNYFGGSPCWCMSWNGRYGCDYTCNGCSSLCPTVGLYFN